ncbi:D-2-hydroxyacid dehydrogenase [Moraxella catarrhalis]|uniref:D-3-phosphoglycerate dehydrogenase n=1 Tax=Moraxella catarrhalis TaxID=480 RepID=A0AB36DNM8_MORCA|nr:D-2-hydroxyacid dehydrogenase [Moraxella catarrhalis]MPX28787.1 hydroxyacid dehydrogenase [Moraxella catarrhalis]OAV04356.1 D-3-phosphoglycerate dehydrogenase [Moraxella catarrhalis]OAV14081.1 D-3-phosphoglycerate dehydrogenase [Moraxella catarrhalis]OAV25484.1 D-3-phosphoglycerate dehydrogenase [Moraxella catarrhalis]RKL87020.1 D-2-hydroxyacid dehydrogenase [Moraxella catarrhalis]
MKAVFLDAGTFSKQACLPTPKGVTEYQAYSQTPQDDEIIIQRCCDAQIVITNKVVITRNILKALPKLRLIQLTATGMDNVDKQACQDLGITLKNVAGYSVNSVPEHTLMMMLAIMRGAKYYHQRATDGTWQADGRFCLLNEPLFDLYGQTLGIIGAGNIGRRVGELAKAFGMHVLYAEHQGKTPRSSEYTDFETVLNSSNVISLHCPLTDATKHLINTDTLAKMHKKPLIINVARGGVVCGADIVDALINDHILGYASDVFESEPFAKNDPLLGIADHPRVLFTPHNAWGSLAAQEKLWEILANQITDFINNHSTHTP